MTDRHDCASGFSQSFNLGAEFSRKLVFRKESSRDPAQHSVGSLRLDRSRFACSVKTQTVAPGRNASLSKIARAGPQGFLSNIDHSLGPRHRKCVSLCRCPSLSMDNPLTHGNADDCASRVGIRQSEICYRRLSEAGKTDSLPMRPSTARARSPTPAFDNHWSTLEDG